MARDPSTSRSDFFVLEYSPSQIAWHIQHIEDLIQTNLLSYIDQSIPRDYILMGVGQTREELHLLQEEITKTFSKIHPDTDPDDVKAPTKYSLISWIRKIFRGKS
jgi:hypothetical protein